MSKAKSSQKSAYFGVLFLLLFGMAWLIAPILSSNTMHNSLAWLLFVAEAVFLLWAIRKWRKLPGAPTKRAVNQKFNFILGMESIAIVAAVFVCRALQVSDATGAAIAIVVGVHFIPLAKLFALPLYNLLAVLLVIAGAACFAIIVTHPNNLSATLSIDYAVSAILAFIAGLTVARYASKSRI